MFYGHFCLVFASKSHTIPKWGEVGYLHRILWEFTNGVHGGWPKVCVFASKCGHFVGQFPNRGEGVHNMRDF